MSGTTKVNLKVGYSTPYKGLAFALAGPTKDEKVLSQATAFFSCRDYINDSMIAKANQAEVFMGGTSKDGDYDFNKLRLLVTAGIAPFGRTMPSVIRILNIYEELGKFSGRSEFERASTTSANPVWIINGPKEWMKCSQLTSMVTLISRIMFWLKKDTNVTTIDGLDNFWKKQIKQFNEGHTDYNSQWDINTALDLCYPRWRVLMENFSSIFYRLGPKSLFPKKYVNQWHGPGGIYSLCSFDSRIEKVDRRFRNACIKAGIVN